MIPNILTVARYTFIGTFRNRISWVLLLFGLLIMGASLLLGLLSQEQEMRMLLDLGLAAIEILSLLIAVFIMVNLILDEMKSRTIYLVLTRSLNRAEYLTGKFLGASSAVLVCVVLMTFIHLVILYFKGWHLKDGGILYFCSVFMSFEKIVLISALTVLFSLISSSEVVALVFAFFFWTLGHFSMELKFLAQQITNHYLKLLFKGIYILIPHFQYLNARDLWVAVHDRFGSFVIEGTLYVSIYTAFAVFMATLAFRKKEF